MGCTYRTRYTVPEFEPRLVVHCGGTSTCGVTCDLTSSPSTDLVAESIGGYFMCGPGKCPCFVRTSSWTSDAKGTILANGTVVGNVSSPESQCEYPPRVIVADADLDVLVLGEWSKDSPSGNWTADTVS